MGMMNTQTIARDAATAATAHLEEQLQLPPRDVELVFAVVEAAVEAAFIMERGRLLKPEEN